VKKGLVIAGVLVLAFVFLFSAAFAQMAKKEEPKKGGPKEITVTGEVVDLACYIKMGATGAGHKECATNCAKAGIPLGILDAKGELYLPSAKEDMKGANDILLPFVAEKVTVTGKLFEKGGQKLLSIEKVEKYAAK
jgi:hypothetical protein